MSYFSGRPPGMVVGIVVSDAAAGKKSDICTRGKRFPAYQFMHPKWCPISILFSRGGECSGRISRRLKQWWRIFGGWLRRRQAQCGKREALKLRRQELGNEPQRTQSAKREAEGRNCGTTDREATGENWNVEMGASAVGRGAAGSALCDANVKSEDATPGLLRRS
jgi:hypothetical protein